MLTRTSLGLDVVHPDTVRRHRASLSSGVSLLPLNTTARVLLPSDHSLPLPATVEEEGTSTDKTDASEGTNDNTSDSTARETLAAARAGATVVRLLGVAIVVTTARVVAVAVRRRTIVVRLVIVIVEVKLVVRVVVTTRAALPVILARGVEAGNADVEGRGLDEADVSAGVEGLVLGLVEVGDVLDLEGGEVAGRGGVRGVRDGDAGVADVELVEVLGVDEGPEVVVGAGV